MRYCGINLSGAGRHRPVCVRRHRPCNLAGSIEAALLKVKAPMAGHGRGVDRTSMSPAANAGSCWWFHLRASRCNDAAGRAI